MRRQPPSGAGGVVVFYYSGHGAAEKDTNINYLIPIDDHLNLFQNVKETVLASTGGAQQPWSTRTGWWTASMPRCPSCSASPGQGYSRWPLGEKERTPISAAPYVVAM
jgi:hypothetical protein